MDFDGDLSWAQDEVVDSHLGQGSAIFRADHVRTGDGHLPLAPQILLSPIFLQNKMGRLPMATMSPQAQYDARMDALLEQFAHDMLTYSKMVCDTVVITVPKSIVHCMVKKSEKNLLERLFNVIHHLTPMQIEGLLKEEPEIVLRRQASRKTFEAIKTGIFQIQQLIERQYITPADEKPDRHTLSAELFALSGELDFLSADQRAAWSRKFDDPYVPDAIKFKAIGPYRTAKPAATSPNLGRTSMAPGAPGSRSAASTVPGPSPLMSRIQAVKTPGAADLSRPSMDARRAPPPPPVNGAPARRPPPPPPGK
jgi:hypothetical protein